MYSHVSKILRVYSSDEGCTQPAVVLLDDERQTIFYKGIMPSEVGFRFSSGL